MNDSELLELTFENNTDKALWIWTEMLAYGLDIPPRYEYKIITDEKHLRLQFENNNLTLFFETRFGFKVLKRKQGEDWELDLDMSDVQYLNAGQ